MKRNLPSGINVSSHGDEDLNLKNLNSWPQLILFNKKNIKKQFFANYKLEKNN